MNGVIFVCLIVELIAQVQCESDSTGNDHSIVRGIAAKIGFPSTVLKVFIKGDIQADEIEKFLNLCTRQDKVREDNNDSDLTRNRRNSISDYIGKLYSFNNLFRPYRGFKQVQTTRTPWLKKLLRGVQEEPKTESFWGMALGAHTFSPLARPLAQTKIPYHRIRNQQRIDRLLGITRNYGNLLAVHNKDETKPYHWIKNQEKFGQLLGQARSEETTRANVDQSQNATTRKAFHKVPLDVAGLKPATFSHHLHPITTPRHLKFCEKPCPDELEEERSIRPGQPRTSGAGQRKSTSENQKNTATGKIDTPDKCPATEKSTCTVDACGDEDDDDYLCNEEEPERSCKGLIDDASGAAVTKNVAQTKRTTYKVTTSRFTRSKERRTRGPVWTLPPNAVLDQTKTTEEQRRTLPATRVTPEDTELRSTMAYTTATSTLQWSGSSGHTSPSPVDETGEPRSCKHGRPTKHPLCIPMPIPTRIRIPYCPHQKTTRRCSRKTTCSTTEDTLPDTCKCRSRNPPSQEIPISIGDALDDEHKKPCEHNKGKPQKIIVRISAALEEVPVVIMRDNGVSGVSLSLVSDYLLDENNRLIKCLSQKPLRGRMDANSCNKSLNSSNNSVPHPKGYKSRHFLPNLIRHQLHGLQPKRYSFRINYNPSHRLVSGPRASLSTGNAINIPNPALNRDGFPRSGFPNQFPSYKSNSPDSWMTGMGSFGFYPPIQNPRNYPSFKMEPVNSPSAELGPIGLRIPQMNFDAFPAKHISPTKYRQFKIHPGMNLAGAGTSRYAPPALNLQQQAADTSELAGYRSPFLPLFYPNKNDGQPSKYVIGAPQ